MHNPELMHSPESQEPARLGAAAETEKSREVEQVEFDVALRNLARARGVTIAQVLKDELEKLRCFGM